MNRNDQIDALMLLAYQFGIVRRAAKAAMAAKHETPAFLTSASEMLQANKAIDLKSIISGIGRADNA